MLYIFYRNVFHASTRIQSYPTPLSSLLSVLYVGYDQGIQALFDPYPGRIQVVSNRPLMTNMLIMTRIQAQLMNSRHKWTFGCRYNPASPFAWPRMIIITISHQPCGCGNRDYRKQSPPPWVDKFSQSRGGPKNGWRVRCSCPPLTPEGLQGN